MRYNLINKNKKERCNTIIAPLSTIFLLAKIYYHVMFIPKETLALELKGINS